MAERVTQSRQWSCHYLCRNFFSYFLVFYNHMVIRGEVQNVGCNKVCQNDYFLSFFHWFVLYYMSFRWLTRKFYHHLSIARYVKKKKNKRLTLQKMRRRGRIFLNHNMESTYLYVSEVPYWSDSRTSIPSK